MAGSYRRIAAGKALCQGRRSAELANLVIAGVDRSARRVRKLTMCSGLLATGRSKMALVLVAAGGDLTVVHGQIGVQARVEERADDPRVLNLPGAIAIAL